MKSHPLTPNPNVRANSPGAGGPPAPDAPPPSFVGEAQPAAKRSAVVRTRGGEDAPGAPSGANPDADEAPGALQRDDDEAIAPHAHSRCLKPLW